MPTTSDVSDLHLTTTPDLRPHRMSVWLSLRLSPDIQTPSLGPDVSDNRRHPDILPLIQVSGVRRHPPYI
ncbi:unnamed protein product, partial [marine sediment metagenome]